ncbi:unnamed protein product [Natator depressus]
MRSRGGREGNAPAGGSGPLRPLRRAPAPLADARTPGSAVPPPRSDAGPVTSRPSALPHPVRARCGSCWCFAEREAGRRRLGGEDTAVVPVVKQNMECVSLLTEHSQMNSIDNSLKISS